jgi:hypothetical protein
VLEVIEHVPRRLQRRKHLCIQVAVSELMSAMGLMCLVEDMWSWLTEVPAAYLCYIDKW